MSHAADSTTGRGANISGPTSGSGTDPETSPSTGQLVSQLSEEVSRLVRDELQLAKVEVSGKAKKAGIGAGMFGAAGLLTLYGLGVLIATAILALSLALEAWLAALVVAVVLLAVAGVVALLGKKRVQEGAPPLPTRAIDNVKADVDVLRHPREH